MNTRHGARFHDSFRKSRHFLLNIEDLRLKKEKYKAKTLPLA